MNPDAAYVELAQAKREVRASRRAFTKAPESAFVRAMLHAMGLYRQARAAGVSREDACKGIEEELRAVWPKATSRFTPACDTCGDTGVIERTCWDRQRCGRRSCAESPERQHAYVEACHCEKGRRFQPKARRFDDDIAAAGKVKKPKGWRQVGA